MIKIRILLEFSYNPRFQACHNEIKIILAWLIGQANKPGHPGQLSLLIGLAYCSGQMVTKTNLQLTPLILIIHCDFKYHN